MPWTSRDAKQKNRAIRSDKEARMWMQVANTMLASLLKKGTKREDAERRAIMAANAAVKNMHEKGGATEEHAMSTNEILQEFVDSRGIQLAVNRESSVIEGVKILGLHSRNGREYLKEAVARALPMYEGKPVNVNHPKGSPTAPRDYQDRIGQIRNVRIEQGDGGLRADFHFNPKHAMAEQLIWDAEHSPESVGFSHNVQAKIKRSNGTVIVENISAVQAVDLVTAPATTKGLFENTSTQEDQDVNWKEITQEELKAERPDLMEAISAAALADQTDASEVERLKAGNARLTADVKTKDARLAEQTKRIDEYEVKEKQAVAEAATVAAKAEKEKAIQEELDAAKLPEVLVTDVFRKSLSEAADVEARKALLEDRAKLKAVSPQSMEQHRAGTESGSVPTTGKELAKALTE